MRKTAFSFVGSFLILTGAMVTPVAALADHSDAHTIQQLQSQFASIQQALAALLAAKPVEPPGQAKKDALGESETSKKKDTVIESATPDQSSPETQTPATPKQPTTFMQPSVPVAHPEAETKRKQDIQQLQDQIQFLSKKVEEFRAKTPPRSSAPIPTAIQPTLIQPTSPQPSRETTQLTRPLQRGVSGEDVRGLQGFLKKFPDIYPQGLETGFFGPATQQAVKKLQEKLGLEALGQIGPQTSKKLNELAVAIDRKHPPKITSIAPSSVALGSPLTVTGSGFTLVENKIMVRGRIISQHNVSPDGTSLVFSLPLDAPCAISQACPIKIVNTNGISNAKPIKIIEAVPPPTITPPPPTPPPPPPTPTPIPTPPPPPPSPTPTPTPPPATPPPTPPPPPPAPQDTTSPVRSEGAPAGALPSGATQAGLSLTTNENATCRYATTTNVSYSAMVSVFSTTGGVQHSTVVGSLADGKSYAYYVRCQDATGNSNSDDYSIVFSIASPPPPTPQIASITPSVGIAGTQATLAGSGFTATGNAINFGGMNNAVANLSSSDGKTLVFTVPSTTPCQPIQSCALSATNANGTSNTTAFTLLQTVIPVAVTSPNGGERLVQGVDYAIGWSGGKDRVDAALVAEGATLGSDPSDLLVGYLAVESAPNGSLVWNAKRACDRLQTTCFDVAPGNYKILAVSEDELGQLTVWDPVANKSGNIDLSDQAFTIVASPRIEVVTPNGGEAIKIGDEVTIAWNATSIASRAVTIALLKAGSQLATIASRVPQSATDGSFFYRWIIPASLAAGSDYAIEISDAAVPSVKDASDNPFKISPLVTLKIVAPNGAETSLRGFSAQVFWEYSGYTPASININLYKGGVFYRTLATSVKQAGYSGPSFLNQSYASSLRYAEAPLALDIPEGNDYTLEIRDGADASLRDFSDAPFSIITLPSPVTFKGRLLDRFTLAPIAGVQLGGYGSYTYMDGRTTSIAHPRTTTDANGAFSFATTTDQMVSEVKAQALIGVWPSCYDSGMAALNRYAPYPVTTVNIAQDFSLQYPNSSSNYKYFPLLNSLQDWGDQLLWPMTSIKTYSDIPVTLSLEYQNDFGLIGGGGNSLYKLGHELSVSLPLNLNARVKLVDQTTTAYVSPFTRLALDYGCAPKAISFMDGTFQWEPYPIGITYTWTGGSVGSPMQATLKTTTYAPYGGVAPFTWKALPGSSLPPGTAFDAATGVLSGTPTAVGTYTLNVRVTDANNVRASSALSFTIR